MRINNIHINNITPSTIRKIVKLIFSSSSVMGKTELLGSLGVEDPSLKASTRYVVFLLKCNSNKGETGSAVELRNLKKQLFHTVVQCLSLLF